MKRLSLLTVLAALAVGVSALASTAAAAPAPAVPTTALTQNVTGTLAGGTGNVTGAVTVTGFQVVNGVVNAVATFTGSVTDAAGNVVSGTQQILIPITQATGSCPILHLELGPLDLNLLGLQVHLDRVVLDITAQSGPGNLLGNLLCAVAHLLDGPAAPVAVANMLNHILQA